MNYRPLRLSATVLLTLTAAAAPADEAPQYRNPGEMTVEERSAIMQRVNDYNTCVFRESMARVDALPDIRQAADEGLGACKASLDAVREEILGCGFEPAFAEQFARHSQNRAVHRLIPELSLRKGGR